MSYLVLARKWRPKRFAELVGQEHVVRALTNALETGRVHHAFLFTGTRGVGKTTIARIFAKSLNCEQGTSADPCGECATCRDIDSGRFFDLIEIDAASNTGVDDVREVIENAQYMPSRGRVKVYLIDEVHMLSKAAFNALLKTLEEPPGHVKFLLATTDPQKLPVTVLSRCLQFNLKRLDEAQISGQISKILAAEGIAAEPGAIRQLSKAADGSLRDGLSLLDQAIAYAGANSSGAALGEAAVATMLGSVDRTRVGALLAALAEGDGAALLAEVAALAEFSPDWGTVLDALSDAMHRIQVRQLVPGAPVETDGVDVDGLAAQVRPEVVQLWYQMALNGRRDIPLAPSPRAGFEMTVLRMLAFRPAEGGAVRVAQADAAAVRGGASGVAVSTREAAPPREAVTASAAALGEDASMRLAPVAHAAEGPPAARPTAAVVDADDTPPWAEAPTHTPAPTTVQPAAHAGMASVPPVGMASTEAVGALEPANTADTADARVPESHCVPARAAAPIIVERSLSPDDSGIADADAWHAFVAGCDLRGPARLLAEHAVFIDCREGVLQLALTATDEHLGAPNLVKLLAEALVPVLGAAPQIRFSTSAEGESVRARNERARDERQAAAEETFMNNPEVQRLIAQHGAKVVPDSIRPFDE